MARSLVTVTATTTATAAVTIGVGGLLLSWASVEKFGALSLSSPVGYEDRARTTPTSKLKVSKTVSPRRAAHFRNFDR